MGRSHEEKIKEFLAESSNDVSRIAVVHPPMSAIIDEIASYCVSCASNAEQIGDEKYVPVARLQHLQSWVERKKAELVEISLIKQGEVNAYKKALEALAPGEQPGPSALDR